jgi:hypothetical protein
MAPAGTRWLVAAVGAFDLAVGLLALLSPQQYGAFVHSGHLQDFHLVRRMGVIWLGFAAVALVAFAFPRQVPSSLFLLGMLHGLEAPADAAYVLLSPDLNQTSRVILAVFPALDLLIAGWLLKSWRYYQKEEGPMPAELKEDTIQLIR